MTPPQAPLTPYPTYPTYPNFPTYYAYPPQPPQVPPDAPTPPRQGRWFVAAFGVLLALVTVGALALAAYAPSTVTPLRGPSTWTQVYSQTLSQAGGEWDTANGCSVDAHGLYAASRAACAFIPSQQHDLTSQGFFFTVTVAPAGDVPQEEQAAIGLGDDLQMLVDQSGAYTLYYNACPTDSPAGIPSNTQPTDVGEVPALHTDPLVANTLSVLYDASARTFTFAANGQPFLTQQVCLNQPSEALALGAPDGGVALYTSATLKSATGGQ